MKLLRILRCLVTTGHSVRRGIWRRSDEKAALVVECCRTCPFSRQVLGVRR